MNFAPVFEKPGTPLRDVKISIYQTRVFLPQTEVRWSYILCCRMIKSAGPYEYSLDSNRIISRSPATTADVIALLLFLLKCHFANVLSCQVLRS